MSEETDSQRPLETNAAAERPRRPRRRFPRRHDGPRGRGPEEQRGDLNGPADRVEQEAGRVPENMESGDGGQRDRSQRSEQEQSSGPSQNGEVERDPEFGDGVIEISGKGFGFLRDS